MYDVDATWTHGWDLFKIAPVCMRKQSLTPESSWQESPRDADCPDERAVYSPSARSFAGEQNIVDPDDAFVFEVHDLTVEQIMAN
jgi:hypothetical protein